MTTLRVLVIDPQAVVRATPSSTWVTSSAVGEVPSFCDADDGRAEAQFCREICDAAVIRVDHRDGAARRLRIWKGLESSFEPFFSIRASGDVIVADHFRNAMAMLPVDERRPDDAVFADHFLYRHRRGRDTYSPNVSRPAHGESIDVDLGSGALTRTTFATEPSTTERRPVSAYVDDIDDALRDVTERVRRLPDPINMLSGGGDSTLVQSYLGPEVPALNVGFDSKSLHFGNAHLDAAAAALGIDVRRITLDDDGLAHLERSVDDRGIPPHFPQWTTLGRVFDEVPQKTFVVGERAGRFSHIGGPIVIQARRLQRGPGRAVRPLVALGGRLTGSVRLNLLAREAVDLRRDPSDPRGWASQISVYADLPLVERVLGPEIIDQRHQRRIDYIAERVDLLPASAPSHLRHAEMAGWMMFYNENVTQFRQMAFAHGRTVIDPFIVGPLPAAAAKIPVIDRFLSGTKNKYLIAELVRRRVPGYPKTVPKDQIAIPFKEQYRNGTLARAWERYEVPSQFTGADRERLLDRPSQTTWNAITWAVWKSRIVDDVALTTIGEADEHRWSIGRSGN